MCKSFQWARLSGSQNGFECDPVKPDNGNASGDQINAPLHHKSRRNRQKKRGRERHLSLSARALRFMGTNGGDAPVKQN